MTADLGGEMLNVADEETETGIVKTLSLELPRRVRSTSGRTRSSNWKLGSKTSSLDFFFEVKKVVEKAHPFGLGVGGDNVLSELEFWVLKTEESLRVNFSIENSGIELGCDPTSLLVLLHYSRSKFQMIKAID